MGSFSKCRGGGQAQTILMCSPYAPILASVEGAVKPRQTSRFHWHGLGLASVEGAVKPRLLMLSATTGCI